MLDEAYESFDQENVKEKHEKIHGKFVSIMPPGEEEQFPHPANLFTRKLVALVIKQICVK